MGAVTIEETISAEAMAKANGWTEDQLLTLAGKSLGRAIGRFFPHPGTVIGYLGKGHNAGDALVALRILRDEFGWDIGIRNAFPLKKCAPLMLEKWDELGMKLPLDRVPEWQEQKRPLVLLDGLLGTGTKGCLREPIARFTAEMNSLREKAGALIAAVDQPTGIDADTGEAAEGCVKADITFMIANAKLGLIKGMAASTVGGLSLVPVDPLSSSGASELEIISPQSCDFGKSPRSFDFHKGMAGRVAILAGSGNYQGAAVLAATGALRGGAGLVTLFVLGGIQDQISSKCPPEVILHGISDPLEILNFRHDSLVIGCGLGELEPAVATGVLELIDKNPSPMVVDADALNLIAKSEKPPTLTDRHVITPHPGEFERLAPELNDLSREEAALRFTGNSPAVLLLKGARTIVTGQGFPLRCNSTGSPGMASGGQGDLLAGVIGALIAAGHSPFDSASLGAWICGRSAEIALEQSHLSEESLLASDVLHFIGQAFRDWKTANR